MPSAGPSRAFNHATSLYWNMHLCTSWKRRNAEKKAKKQAKARSDEIDQRLKEESVLSRSLRSALLISIPESEAAAFSLVQNMKIAHGGLQARVVEFRPVIWKILLQNSRRIVMAIQSRNLGPISLSNKAKCEYIMNHRIDTDSPEFSFRPKFSRAVQDLWAEQVIPMLLEHPPRISVDDNAAYFFSEAQRITAGDYVPSVADVLHTADRGILETYFKFDRFSVRVLQSYGQEFKLKTWFRHFESVKSIIFCASLCDYDVRGVAAEGEQTQLLESLVLFEAVVNSRWFFQTSVLLFLTDINDFGAKLHDAPLAHYFPEYTGGTDVNMGARYILSRFKQLNRLHLTVYPRITQLSDANFHLQQLFTVVARDSLYVLREAFLL